MATTLPELQARRAIEDAALRVRADREELQHQLARNTQNAIDLVRPALESGLSLDQLADLIGVSRQTLYRWRVVADRLRPGETAAELASKRMPSGEVAHYFG